MIALSAIMTACVDVLNPIPPTGHDFNAIEMSTSVISDNGRTAMDGVYAVDDGKEAFTDTVSVRWVDNRLCIYTASTAVLCETAAGLRGDTVIADGYFRFIRSDRTGRFRYRVEPSEGGEDIASDKQNAQVTIRGVYVDQQVDGQAHKIVFRRVRDLPKKESPFTIIGHRGGGRNSERFGISENTLGMIKFAKKLGATGVEIDVFFTKDDKAIVFHDATFSPRTVQGAYLLGDVKNFTLTDIRRYVKLYYGEQVPTLEELLLTVVDSTEHEFVWLDMKDADAVNRTLQIQKQVLEYAKRKGRNQLEIAFGIPSTAILDAYNAAPLKDSTQVLCELDQSIAQSLPSCTIWAPRFTFGTQEANVAAWHAHKATSNAVAGLKTKVYVWTVDRPDVMANFVEVPEDNDRIDGILTNYPSVLAATYYQRGKRFLK
jgi:glycerophosphoryl diester phosphodiesterase